MEPTHPFWRGDMPKVLNEEMLAAVENLNKVIPPRNFALRSDGSAGLILVEVEKDEQGPIERRVGGVMPRHVMLALIEGIILGYARGRTDREDSDA